MPAQTPQQLQMLFSQYFSSADLQGLASLYESAAVLVPQPGERATGVEAIKAALAGFLALKGRFELAPAKVVQAGDIALLFAQWSLDGEDADGNAVKLAGQTADVARKQPDGRWLFLIDNPFGAAGAG